MLLFTLALAGTTSDLVKAKVADGANDPRTAHQAYSRALAPPGTLKPKRARDAWEGLARTQTALRDATDPETLTGLANQWVAVKPVLGSLDPELAPRVYLALGSLLEQLGRTKDPEQAAHIAAVGELFVAVQPGLRSSLLVAQAYERVGLHEKMLATLETAVTGYERSPTTPPDKDYVLVAGELARQVGTGKWDEAAVMHTGGDRERALAMLDRADAQLERDVARADAALRKDLEAEEVTLLTVRAGLLQGSGDARELPVLERLVELRPGEPHLLVALAGAQQATDPTLAEKTLRKGLEAYPDDLNLNFNLGATFVNRASDLQAKAANADGDQAMELQDQAMAELVKAKPYFETVLRVDPSQSEVVRQLMQIAMIEGDMEAYGHYKALLGG